MWEHIFEKLFFTGFIWLLFSAGFAGLLNDGKQNRWFRRSIVICLIAVALMWTGAMGVIWS